MLNIFPVPAFQDNYLWMFHQEGDNRACVVDPGDAGPVFQALEQRGLTLSAILVTHHHADHIGGIDALLAHTRVPVYGPDSPQIPQITNVLAENDEVEVLDTTFRVLEIPGHTLDHIAYFAQPAEGAPVLFCGDTLFAGGCGRVFEGTYPMMHTSLQKLAMLPPETRVFCAHEYTLANLKFALAVTPDDAGVKTRMDNEKEKRAQNIPTVPTTIGQELDTNPFLRCESDGLRQAVIREGMEASNPTQVFAAVRAWKDRF